MLQQEATMWNLERHMSKDYKGPEPHLFGSFLGVVSGNIVFCR
jgi:hypothetical protein